MGREIRRVPANWEHPKETDGTNRGGGYHPMRGENYEKAMREWFANHNAWLDGTHHCLVDKSTTREETPYFADWDGNPPDVADYVKYEQEECTHFQMYETVTEGTPVTPVFASLQELEDYLVNVGEMAGTRYNKKYSREGAHAFCHSGWAPSMVYTPATGMISRVEASKIK
jgi:hypothetical protein